MFKNRRTPSTILILLCLAIVAFFIWTWFRAPKPATTPQAPVVAPVVAPAPKPRAIIHRINPMTGKPTETWEASYFTYGTGYINFNDMHGHTFIVMGDFTVEYCK